MLSSDGSVLNIFLREPIKILRITRMFPQFLSHEYNIFHGKVISLEPAFELKQLISLVTAMQRRQMRRHDPLEFDLDFCQVQTDSPDLKKVKIDKTIGRSCLLMFSFRIHTSACFETLYRVNFLSWLSDSWVDC